MLLLAIGLPLYCAFIMWFLIFVVLMLVTDDANERLNVVRVMFSPGRWQLDQGEAWVVFGIPGAALLATQAMFVMPLVSMRPLQAGRAGSLRLSMVGAGFVAAALTLGLALGLFGLMQLLVANWSGEADPSDADVPGQRLIGAMLIAVMVLSWLFWSIVLMAFARRRDGRGVIPRVAGLLLGGTIAEVLVVLPLDIMVRRRTDCYCATGSFWTLCLSAWALLWLTGPGIVLALTSKRRRLWWETHCMNCGYEKGPSPGERCPECGFEWSPETNSAKPQAADR